MINFFLILDCVGLVTTQYTIPSGQKKLLFQWNSYVVVLCIFHFGEFFITASFNPNEVNADSFVITHSKSYTFAMIFSTVEFWIKFSSFPDLNSNITVTVGFVFCFVGQLVRSIGMMTCGKNFNHMIQHKKTESHVLVTKGM